MRLLLAFRVTVVVLLACFTACLTLSSLLPLFRKNTYNPLNGEILRVTYYYWYVENTIVPPDTVWSSVRQYTRDAPCSAIRGYYVAASVFSVIGTALGGLVTVIGAAWIAVGYSVALSIVVFVCTAVSFVCSTVVLGLMARAYHHDICTTDYTWTMSLNEAGFRRVEGFILMAIAMAGFTVVVILQVVGFFCGCMIGKGEGVRGDSDKPHREPAVPQSTHHGDASTPSSEDHMHGGHHSNGANPYSKTA